MKQLIHILSIVFFLATGGLQAEEVSRGKELKMKIDGMTCGACAMKIKNNLSNLCKETSIDYKKGEGLCLYQEGKATPEEILKAVEKSGFKAKAVN